MTASIVNQIDFLAITLLDSTVAVVKFWPNFIFDDIIISGEWSEKSRNSFMIVVKLRREIGKFFNESTAGQSDLNKVFNYK